jgi:hypothetical protein
VGAILLASLFILTGQKGSTYVYQNSQCGFSFEYPNGWQIVKKTGYLTICTATLRPVDYERLMAEDDVDVYTLTVQVSRGGTLEEAAEENGFEFDRKWTVLGRQGISNEAHLARVKGWMILRGTAEIGCFHEKGGYAGLCAEDRVVAKHQRDDDRVVVITALPQAGDPIDTILKTIKFLTR